MRRTAFAAIVLAVLGGLTATQGADAPSVQVRKDDARYVVTAQFEVAADPRAVLRVLGDYDEIPQFIPRVKRSVVTLRDGHHLVVEQTVAARLLMFSKELHLVLDVHEDGNSIEFRDTCNRSFDSYAGSWVVRPSSTGSRVVYELSATPSFDVPSLVLGRLLKRDSMEMIESLRHAIQQNR